MPKSTNAPLLPGLPPEIELVEQFARLNAQVVQLMASNSKLYDEVATLKGNYNRLVEDVNVRLEVVHKKLFR